MRVRKPSEVLKVRAGGVGRSPEIFGSCSAISEAAGRSLSYGGDIVRKALNGILFGKLGVEVDLQVAVQTACDAGKYEEATELMKDALDETGWDGVCIALFPVRSLQQICAANTRRADCVCLRKTNERVAEFACFFPGS